MTIAKRFTRCRSLWLLCLFGMATAVGGREAEGAESATAWLTGSALRQRLATPVGVEWSGSPLRPALVGLARAQQVAMFVDRRVDPEEPLTATFKDVRLEDIFRQVAEGCGLGVAQWGSVTYVGPRACTSRLRTVAALRLAEIRALAGEAGWKFAKADRLQWADFAEPREILAQLAGPNDLTINGLAQVPHDLWPAADLPPLALVDRLTLVLAQFGLTFQAGEDGKSLTLVAIPEVVAITRTYPAGRQADETLRQWTTLAPGSRIRRSGSQIIVEGPLEDHERIASTNRPSPRTPAKPAVADLSAKRFTVRQARGPLGAMLQQLGERVGVTLRFDREALQRAGISLDQQISFSVEDATIDELLEAALKPAGCAFERQGTVVIIAPAP